MFEESRTHTVPVCAWDTHHIQHDSTLTHSIILTLFDILMPSYYLLMMDTGLMLQPLSCDHTVVEINIWCYDQKRTWTWSSVSECVPSMPPWTLSLLYSVLGHGLHQIMVPHPLKPDQLQSELPELHTHWGCWENLCTNSESKSVKCIHTLPL